MKKLIIIMAMCLILCGCEVKGRHGYYLASIDESEKFTKEEIQEAVFVVEEQFEFNNGMQSRRLLWIGYDEKDSEERVYNDLVRNYNVEAENSLVINTAFIAGGELGPLNPNSLYTDWRWYMTKDESGNWTILSHGLA